MGERIERVASKTDVMHTQAQVFKSLSARDMASSGPHSSCAAEVTVALRKRGWAFLKVSGKSMFPWIREGDIVFLRYTGMREICRGDVVVFEKNGTLCVHRVLAIRGKGSQVENGISLITKGDATVDADSPVSRGEFLGKVEFVYRRNKEVRIASGWRKTFGRFLAFLSPTVAWYRPLPSKPTGSSARSESRPSCCLDGRGSPENSAG